MKTMRNTFWQISEWGKTLKSEMKEKVMNDLERKRKILVVDDDWSILELLKFKLEYRGYEVITARTEKEFWDRAFNTAPDLIILDIWLGNKIGTHIYENLINFGFDPDIPVIFITALLEDHPPKQSVEGGKYALFGKPFDFDMMLREVEKLVEPKMAG